MKNLLLKKQKKILKKSILPVCDCEDGSSNVNSSKSRLSRLALLLKSIVGWLFLSPSTLCCVVVVESIESLWLRLNRR